MSTFTQRKRYTPGSHRLNRIDLVVKTGSSGTEIEDDAGSSGADDTVIKPLSVCSIIAIVFSRNVSVLMTKPVTLSPSCSIKSVNQTEPVQSMTVGFTVMFTTRLSCFL